MDALHPQLHPKLGSGAEPGDKNAPNAPLADLHHQNAEYPATHTPPQPTAHCNTEFARTFVSENDTRSLVSAPDFAPALAELAQIDQWVIGARDKRPLTLNDAGNGLRAASHSEPSDWMTYAAAEDAIKMDGAWLGFVFCEHDPYTGIDIDGCRDPKTGAIEAWAQYWIDRLNSYTEVSPSGTGVKIWVRGCLALIYKLGPHKGIEVYHRTRYFTMTGNHLPGTPETINEAQAVLDEMAKELDPSEPKVERKPTARKVSPGERAAEEMELTDRYALAREYILANYDLVDALTDAGAKKTRSGYSCPFCKHTHTTTLTIAPSGKAGWSLSPNCALYSRKGFDVTNVLILKDNYRGFDHLARTLAPHCFPQPKPKAERETPNYVTPEQREKRRKDAERKKRERAQAAAELRDDVMARAACDEAMPHQALALLDIHLTIAGQRGWHRASVARMAEMAGFGERWVQRFNEYLVANGYLTRAQPDPTQTAIWTFAKSDTRRNETPKSADDRVIGERSAEIDDRSPVLDSDLDLINSPDLACEGAPTPPPEQLAKRVWRSGNRWGAFDGQRYTWHTSREAAEAVISDTSTPVEPDEGDEGGASYDPGADWTVNHKGRRPPKEADAVRKARRQARLRAMDAPELTHEYWSLTNKAKKCEGRQRETLLDLAAEVQHYRDLAYARRDDEAEDAPRSQARPTPKPLPALSPPMLALFAGGGP